MRQQERGSIYEPQNMIVRTSMSHFMDLIVDELEVDDFGLVVSRECIRDDYHLFHEYLESPDNTNIPRHARTAYINNTIYIKSVPSTVQQYACRGIGREFIAACFDGRVGAETFEESGSSDINIGGENSIQPDVAIRRAGRECNNFVAEVGYAQSTTRLINLCIQHFGNENVHYVLGINIMPLVEGNVANKEVRIFAYLFRRYVNALPEAVNGTPAAPESITYFGNMTLTASAAEEFRTHLVQNHFVGWNEAIVWRGQGFDPLAPPCNAVTDTSDVPFVHNYYRLYLFPNLILEGNERGVPDMEDIPLAAVASLAANLYINLYQVQRRIRVGFHHTNIFHNPKDDDIKRV